jgi:hypothetical protein
MGRAISDYSSDQFVPSCGSKAFANLVTLVFVLLFASAPGFAQSEKLMTAMDERMDQNKPSECSERLQTFVQEIDTAIASNSSVDPIKTILKKYFPMKGCDVEEATRIMRASKYFDRADQYPKEVVFVLRQKIPGGWGFNVTFGLNRETGETVLPNVFVDPSKWEVR